MTMAPFHKSLGINADLCVPTQSGFQPIRIAHVRFALECRGRARQNRLPTCPGQVKITGGQANVKLTCPFGQVVIFAIKIYIQIAITTYKYSIIINFNGNHFPGIASQFAMHFQPFTTHLVFIQCTCCDANAIFRTAIVKWGKNNSDSKMKGKWGDIFLLF